MPVWQVLDRTWASSCFLLSASQCPALTLLPSVVCVLPPLLPSARYIRYIYNRVILENATVRAAALSSLARFGAHCPELRERILILIRRAQFDHDDEVRRAPCSRRSWLDQSLPCVPLSYLHLCSAFRQGSWVGRASWTPEA